MRGRKKKYERFCVSLQQRESLQEIKHILRESGYISVSVTKPLRRKKEDFLAVKTDAVMNPLLVRPMPGGGIEIRPKVRNYGSLMLVQKLRTYSEVRLHLGKALPPDTMGEDWRTLVQSEDRPKIG